MKTKFYKYQSLGNDFILLDWYQQQESDIQNQISHQKWTQFVINSSNRNFGVGADGILILKKNIEDKTPEGLIFNADGSQAELCINGLRCLAHHLFTHHNFPKKFFIKMGNKTIECLIQKNSTSIEIINKIEQAIYLGTKTITVDNQKLKGHIANVGNPHFIIFQKIDLEWLKKYGHKIENHNFFENKTNVEFFWEVNLLVHERGCGITLACGSGTTATVSTLFHLKKIKSEEKIEIQMLGGTVLCHVDKNHQVNLQANAKLVFKGEFF